MAKAKEFYGKLSTGISIPCQSGFRYLHVIKVGDGTGGGMFPMKDAPPMWLPYVLVDDIHAATQKASRWARPIRENHEVPGMGWLRFRGPARSYARLWQAQPRE